MGVLPVKLGEMDAVPPGLRYRIRDVLAMLPQKGKVNGPLDAVALERLTRLEADGEPWFGADPALAEVGVWMTDAKHAVELRRRGCTWLAMFPTVETVRRLAEIVTDPQTPPPVREQAIRALGSRELRAQYPATRWPVDAVQLADEALVKLADAATTAGKIASDELPLAMRHVQWEGAFATFARAPGLWGAALECFASPALARVLLVCLEDIPAPHRLRALRLVAATLGEEAVPMLLARASRAATDEKLEMLFLVVTLAGEPALGAFEDVVRALPSPDLMRQRAKWHLQHRGVVPTVRALRVARATAVIAPDDRERLCGEAADDLAALTRFARHSEAYLYTSWGWLVRGSRDPVRARELALAHPESQRLVRDLYLVDLARRGRVKQLSAAAQALGAPDLGAMHLAIWGRPLAALELAATARVQTPELAYARSLGCYRAGRPDLASRVLAEDLPPAELVDDSQLPAFPGPHEQWLLEHAAETRPALVALAGGLDVMAAGAKPAPFDAEPDTASLESTNAVARRLERRLIGATVYLAGEFKYMNKGAIISAIEKAGARLVNGPFPGTDYYVHGDTCAVQTIVQLERQGARRLREGELEGI